MTLQMIPPFHKKHYERGKLREIVKTRSALDVKRRSGDFVGAFTIYGYVKTGDKHKSLEVDEYAAGVVRDIFRKRLEGFSASHIADELNRMGILSPLAYKRNHGMPHAKRRLYGP